MKLIRTWAAIAALFTLSPAIAQWQITANTIPLGRGSGAIGFNVVGGSAGTGTHCLLDSNPPSFGTCPGGGGGGTPGGTNGQVQYNNAGAFGGFTVGGDGTLNTATGALAVTKTGGVSFGALATATPGTGVAAALAIAVGSAGGPVVNGGALGTPSSGVATNLTGTASGLTAGDVANASVIAKVLTGYVSGAGTVSAADSILSAIQKINGNDALKLPLGGGTMTGTLNMGANSFTSTGTLTSGAQTLTSASANCEAIGANGTTNPVMSVDCSTASVATGWNFKGAAAGSKAAMSVLSSGANEGGTIDAKGTGNLQLQTVATGNVGIACAAPSTTLCVGGVGNSNTDAGFELAVGGSITAQALNRHTGNYAVIAFAGSLVSFQSSTTGAIGSVATNLSLFQGIQMGGAATDPGFGNVAVAGFVATKSPTTLTGTSGSVAVTDADIIVNASGTFTLTLPTASTLSGRTLYVKSIAAQVVNSASSNVVPLAGGAAAAAIFTASAGKFARLKSDGTNWIIMAAN